jgi:ABC-type multidrug transport system ATPase subunit
VQAAVTLRLQQVGKRYGRRWVFEDVDLELPPESLTVVRGANGSGKSTLLRIAAGVTRPSRGTVRRRPQRVALVPDRFAPPRLSGRAYLEHLGRLRGLGPDVRRRRIDELVELLGLVPGPDVPLHALSRGNAKKVALAQAFLAPAELIVLDEPRAALDQDAEAALEVLVETARAFGAAVLVADHADVPGTASRHVLANGRLEPAA